ncbi:RrF2 family transcriptional regulator [Pontiella sulfatireligans]|uniref:HTH-type transcriptional regulator IscR n=1 Tax=Pontiella sulfatireligans TaxID=2750658 RepID=A0A6C2UMG6_9BACT|nr:Rrf2 family transcriptional regulator [Pontiella sulfatireligans]VGO21113.1 HTH-type transcriptional regulator IscR [Pontiella sulfatireligans]
MDGAPSAGLHLVRTSTFLYCLHCDRLALEFITINAEKSVVNIGKGGLLLFRSQGRYAVLVMLCISRREGELPVSKKMISGELGISTGYIEQILVPLKRAGLIGGVRGIHGGFRLAKDASEITVYNILEAEDENLAKAANLKKGRSLSGEFAAQAVWHGAIELFREYFSNITLEDLREGCSECCHVGTGPEQKTKLNELWEIVGGPGQATCWDT